MAVQHGTSGIIKAKINEDAALRFIASRFFDGKVTEQLSGMAQQQLWQQACHEHGLRDQNFMRQLEDVLYSGIKTEIPRSSDGAKDMAAIDSYLDILQKACHAGKGDERLAIPSRQALRYNLQRCQYLLSMVYEAPYEDDSAVRRQHAEYGWRDIPAGGVAILWDTIHGTEVTSVSIPTTSHRYSNATGKSVAAKGCNCAPRSDGRCCVSATCGCRKEKDGAPPRACSSKCKCQQLIKAQLAGEHSDDNSAGAHSMVMCANPLNSASTLGNMAADLRALHPPPVMSLPLASQSTAQQAGQHHLRCGEPGVEDSSGSENSSDDGSSDREIEAVDMVLMDSDSSQGAGD